MSNSNLSTFVMPVGGEHKCKSMMVAEDGLYFISKSGLSSPQDFREAYEKGGVKDLLTTKHLTKWEDIKGMLRKSGSETVSIDLKGMMGIVGGQFNALDFSDNPESIEALFQYAEKVQAMRRSEVQLGAGKAVLPSLGYLALAIGATVWMYSVAGDHAAAEDIYESQGRKKGIIKLVAHFAETVGPLGVLGIGGAISAFLAYRAFRTFQSPPTETRLER